MRNILLTFIFLMSPALSFADDFNYDDDTRIDVSEDEWETPNPDLNLGIDSGTSGIDLINKDNNGTASKRSIMITPKDGSIVIKSGIGQVIPLYSLGSSTLKMLRVQPGTNVFPVPHGIYIIAGKKYML
ncbi:MAG: hypothetical protein NC248_00400 [Bacteroides sp.]|nr:hypothetical protein [Bacteroides sp.]MCM1389162.1 hypothetical protein [Bacteroides sp.]